MLTQDTAPGQASSFPNQLTAERVPATTPVKISIPSSIVATAQM